MLKRNYSVEATFESRDCDGKQEYRIETDKMDQATFDAYIASNVRFYDHVTKDVDMDHTGTVSLTFHNTTDEGFERLEVDYYEIFIERS